ncbi:MAG TPA: TIGR02647 family protein, partial [Halieaceae bacterium]|nr:TIGR02647 family protein [Halieaceae bacterium]
MTLPREQIEEIELLLKFDLSSAQVGLKVHSNANPEMIAAAQRLYGKGLIDQEDGGF